MTAYPAHEARRTTPNASVRLQERDLELLELLFLHRAATRDQLLAFGLFDSQSRLNRRLKQLGDAKLLRRLPLRPISFGFQSVYGISSGSVDLLVSRLGLAREEIALVARRGAAPSFAEHTLRLVDLRLEIAKACEAAGISVDTYLAEPLCRHEYSTGSNGHWQQHILKPDAFTQLRSGDRRWNAFLELDLAHVSGKQIRQAILGYRRYRALGLFAEVYGEPEFELLFITSGGRGRLATLKTLAQDGTSPKIRFTTLDLLEKQGFLQSIWETPWTDARAKLMDQPLIAAPKVNALVGTGDK